MPRPEDYTEKEQLLPLFFNDFMTPFYADVRKQLILKKSCVIPWPDAKMWRFAHECRQHREQTYSADFITIPPVLAFPPLERRSNFAPI